MNSKSLTSKPSKSLTSLVTIQICNYKQTFNECA